MKKLAVLIFTLIMLARPVSAEELIPVGQVIGLELGCGYLSISDFGCTNIFAFPFGCSSIIHE